MRILGPSEVVAALDFTGLIEALRQMFRSGGCEVPLRHHHTIAMPGGGPDGTLLLMPAWQAGQRIGIKLVTVFPGNAAASLPSVMGAYLLLDGKTGEPVALLDGPALTARRTAAASALAARYLARPDCERLLVVGTGALAPHLVEAHAAVRPIRNVLIWGRDKVKAAALAQRLDRRTLKVAATERPRGRGARRACDLLRDAREGAADPRVLAAARRPCRSRRRLHARDARGR